MDAHAATPPRGVGVDRRRLARRCGRVAVGLRRVDGAQGADVPLDTPTPVVTTVAAAFLERVRSLPMRTRTALVLAAASDDGRLSVLTRAGLDVADLAPAEEEAVVVLADGCVVFRHPLLRAAVYADSSPKARRGVHRALAGALPDAEADRRAWHLALATVGPDEPVSSALEQAALRAHGRSAYDVASRAFERAALHAPDASRRAALMYAAADAAWLAGLGERTVALLAEAGDLTTDDVLRGRIEHLLGHVGIRQGTIADARIVLGSAAERVAARAPDQAVVVLAEAAEGAFFAGDVVGMRACAERANALAAGSSNTRSAFFGRMVAGMARILSGEGESGAELIRDAVGILERANELDDDPRLVAWAAFGSLWLRESGVAAALVDRAITTARARSAVGVLPHLLTHIGIDRMAAGRYSEARPILDEAIEYARETKQRTILTEALARLALLDARSGRADSCRVHSGEAVALARETGAHLFEIWALAALGELALCEGEPETARVRFDEQQDALDRYGIGDPDVSPAPERVEANLRLGHLDAAQAGATPFACAARAKRQPWALARAARCRALLAADDEFEPLFEEALGEHARTPDTFEQARTRLAYGARLRRCGHRFRAREQLRAAIDDFDTLGAKPWGELARAELLATGERARRRDPSTIDDLTPQELQVSMLLAGGKTTRAAAAALFLSPKTIEYHLHNAYRKLGIRSREELASVLLRNQVTSAGAARQAGAGERPSDRARRGRSGHR